MSKRNALLLAFVVPLLQPAVLAAGKPWKLYAPHLTRDAFDRVETRLQQVEPGAALEELGIEWDYYSFKKGRRVIDVRAQTDGWIGFLSGGIDGSRALGALTGVSDEFVYGVHVFGYLWERATLVPRYSVHTRARRCTEAEFDSIDAEAPGLRGRAKSDEQVFFYRDVTIEAVRPLAFQEPDAAAGSKEKLAGRKLETTLLALASPEAFARTLERIEALEDRCGFLDAIADLGGIYTTFDFGKNYYLLLPGFLRPWMEEGGDYPLVSISESGRFTIWPFGYLEGRKPKLQMTLVFRNGQLETVLREPSEKSVTEYLLKRRKPAKSG